MELTRVESVKIYTAYEWIDWRIQGLSIKNEDRVFVVTSNQWICSGPGLLTSGCFHRAKGEKTVLHGWNQLDSHNSVTLDLLVSKHC